MSEIKWLYLVSDPLPWDWKPGFSVASHPTID